MRVGAFGFVRAGGAGDLFPDLLAQIVESKRLGRLRKMLSRDRILEGRAADRALRSRLDSLADSWSEAAEASDNVASPRE